VLLAGAVLAGAVLAGCTADPVTTPRSQSRVEVDTPALREVKAELGVEPCPEVDGRGSDLPDLVLPCLGGGPDVSLAAIEGPAVVSMWASWCGPCRAELPFYQRLHEEAGDRLTVLGVDYQDRQPDWALGLLAETGARFPQVADPGGSLADEYRFIGLPVVLLVDADGRVTRQVGEIKSYAELKELVQERTGVSLTRR
jgi:thiol-disulfide isomerase/thioredoxin